MEVCLALCKLQDARTAHLSNMTPGSRVLMLGEGPGRLLEVLARRMPRAQFTVVDQSQSMLFQAKKALMGDERDTDRIHWVHGDVLEADLGKEPYDLVTTPFFLDCFTQAQLAQLIPRISACCSQNAYWLLADFQIPLHKGLQRTRAKWIHQLMYLFFRRVTGMHATHWVDPQGYIERAGFQLQDRLESNLGLIRSDLWKRSA